MRAKIYDWKNFDDEGAIDIECDVEMCMAILNLLESEIDSTVSCREYDKAECLIRDFQRLTEKTEEYTNAKCESTENAG